MMKEISISYFLVKIIAAFWFYICDKIYTSVVLIILKLLLHYFFSCILKNFYVNSIIYQFNNLGNYCYLPLMYNFF